MAKKPSKPIPMPGKGGKCRQGYDWGKEMQYLQDHPNDPAVLAAQQIARDLIRSHGITRRVA